MNPGQIVEFIEEGRVVTAVCVEERKGKIRVMTPTQKELILSPNRLIHTSAERLSLSRTRDEITNHLNDRVAQRETLAQNLDIVELWEVLHEEPNDYSPGELAELSFSGSATDDQTSAVIRAVLADRVHFRFRADAFRPNDPLTVEKIRTQRERERQKEMLLQQGSQWIRTQWDKKSEEPFECEEAVIELLKQYAVHGKNAPKAQQAEELLKRAGMTHALAAFQILVKMGVWSPDENLMLHRFGTRRAFQAEIVEEAKKLNEQTVFPSEGDAPRESLPDLHTVTIDSTHTKDIDDALSVERIPEGYRVWVHITDVSAIVAPGAPLDEEAAARGTSLYLPEERIPMFPPELSEDICSLKENEVRPSVSLSLDVNGEGDILGHRLLRTWIRVSKRMSYDETDRMLQEPDGPLNDLYKLAMRWRQDRIKNGAMILPLPEIGVSVDETGEIRIERRDRESPSQILVSEMMIQTNRIVRKFMKDEGIPCIYRAQAEPRERLIEEPVQDLYLNFKQRRLLTRAEFQLDPGFHHGLGVDAYTTVTSPIRRYLDLVMQRQVTARLLDRPLPYSREDLEHLLMVSDETWGQAIQLEQTRQRYWTLRYLQGQKGLETNALILGRYGQKTQILLTDYMLETMVPSSEFSMFQEGQEISIRIVRVKPMADEIRLEPCH